VASPLRELAYAIGIVCSYVCSDSDYSRFTECRARCIERMRRLVEELRERRGELLS